MSSLATKYRPKKLSGIIGQTATVRVLERQLEVGAIRNAYLFIGASGCGKTTAARILASEVNNNIGQPIEIDAASNNGVDNIRQIIQSAYERSTSSKYKVFILDECHSLTTQAWQALLKIVEEPPKYTIFIFCTTDPQKIPETITNRVQTFTFNKLSQDEIKFRLIEIANLEGYTNFQDSVEYISKNSNGSMREALTNLDKVASYSRDFNIDTTLQILGKIKYELMFNLINSIIDGKTDNILQIIDEINISGISFLNFIDQFISFLLEVYRFIVFKLEDAGYYTESFKNCTNIENPQKYYDYFLDKALELKQAIKSTTNEKDIVTVKLIQMSRLV